MPNYEFESMYELPPHTLTRTEYDDREARKEPLPTPAVETGDPKARIPLAKPEEDWRPKAACLHMPPGMFYPTSTGPDMEAAQAVCRQCPVAEPCLEEDLQRSVQIGIRAGLTERERRRIKRLGRLSQKAQSS